jgi:hypothetical protein
MIRFAACALVLSGAAITGCSGTQDTQCPMGQFYDAQMQTCVAGGGMNCPPGQAWNGSACVATGGGQCPPGQAWNGAACVATGGGQCPAGQAWNGTACVPATGPGPTPQPAANGCTGQAQPMAMGQAPGADQAIAALASQYIPPGARAVGSPIVGNFQAGQCLEQSIQVQMGRCYTVVGASLGAISDLDIELLPPALLPGIPTQVVAQDQGDGPTAVLGGKPNCWNAFVPGPMKLVVRVSGGQGVAGAQLYEK